MESSENRATVLIAESVGPMKERWKEEERDGDEEKKRRRVEENRRW